MNKLTLLLTGALSCSVMANETQNRAMMDMMQAMASQSAENQQVAECLGTSVPKMKAAFNRTIESCFNKLKKLPSEEFADEISVCLELELPSSLGISQDRFQKCDEDASEDNSFMSPEMKALQDKIDRLSSELDALYEKGASESQLERKIIELEAASEQMNSLTEQAFAPGGSMQQEMMKQFDMISQSSESTLKYITLPIYPNAKVMVHMPASGRLELDKQYITLPAATFSSPDDAAKVVDYYAKNLKGFQKKQLKNGEVVFMKNMPADFDILTHMQAYVSQPHVLIKKAEGNMYPNAKTFIELAYEPKK